MPIDPGPCRWALPDPSTAAPHHEVLAAGGDLAPATMLAGYRSGLFAMPQGRKRLLWYSPDPRGVVPIEGFHASRSLRRSAAAFEVSIDQAFHGVLAGCADPARPGGWISRDYRAGYDRLFDLGWAHTVEVWRDGALAGGLLCVELGGLICGETMFHRVTDASKAALWATVAAAASDSPSDRLFDVQWVTAHLASLGAREVPRSGYLAALPRALALDPVLRPMPAAPFASHLEGLGVRAG